MNMKIWNYIGEFFLFRWLWGRLQHAENNNNRVRKSRDFHRHSSDYFGSNKRYFSDSFDSNKYNWESQSDNDFDEEQDDYDMMDDF